MTEIKKDNTEEKILAAAKKVFIEKGMDGARMQEIANEAGINKALLHYYFRTKEKLYEAIFKQVFGQIFPNMMLLVRADKPIDEKLAIFVSNYIDMLLKNPFVPTFILKEMNRKPDFLAVTIRSSGISPDEIFTMFGQEMDKGKIRRMDPRDLLINLLSMSIFPIASAPLMKTMFFNNNSADYHNFIENRKTSVTTFILNSILL